VDQFIGGLSFKFSNVKLKIVSLKLRVTGDMTIKNINSFGGTVQGFSGQLKYGRNGQQIMPIQAAGFPLPANGTGSTSFVSEIPLTSLLGNIISVVQAVVDGSLKKLWLTGTVSTSIINIPVDTEISVLSA
jgi:hypothetical protein